MFVAQFPPNSTTATRSYHVLQQSTRITSEMSGEPPKKTRRPRFSDAELHTIIEEVTKRRNLLFSKHDLKTGVTDIKKQQAWEEVTIVVNAVGRVQRDTEEIKRKFRDMKSHVKHKSAEESKHIAGTGKSSIFCVLLMQEHIPP